MTSGALADLGWERLRTEPGVASSDLGMPSLTLATAAPAGPIRLAIGGEAEPRLLLPLRPGDPFPVVREGRGLVLKDSVFVLHARPVRFIDIVCRERELEPVFREVVIEIVRRIEAGSGTREAVEQTIRDFRALLSQSRRTDVSAEEAIGLIGELLHLNALLELNAKAWASWKGPVGGRNDFRAGPMAMEVKGSRSTQKRIIEISALDQLAEPKDGELFLIFQPLEEDAAGPLTVPDQVKLALEHASDPDAVLDLLSRIGYEEVDKKIWSEFRFAALDAEVYAVKDDFPRLIPSDFQQRELPAGVSRFRYQIDLGMAASFRLRRGAIDDAFTRFLGHLETC